MPLRSLPVVDTRRLFAPMIGEFAELLEQLTADDWTRRTVAGHWLVRDVVAHLIDTSLRRLSFHRDRHPAPASPAGMSLTAFINGLNADWVVASKRLSPQLLATLYGVAGVQVAEFFEHLPLEAPPLFPVSWAAQDADAGWLDIPRDFTEQWHHQMQVREAVGAPPPSDPAWLRAVLAVSMRALPLAYRGTPAHAPFSVRVRVTGPSGGTWMLRHDANEWQVWVSDDDAADARVVMSDDTAWRLLFNALPLEAFDTRVAWTGEPQYSQPLRFARSVIV